VPETLTLNNMQNYEIDFLENTVNAVKNWGESMKKKGFIPTIDLFVENMTEKIKELKTKHE
jgi:hypothetical protein